MVSERTGIKQVINTYLDEQKIAVQNMIRSYPPPIPACDAQFNHLLAKRDGLSTEINRLRKLDEDEEIGEFLATSQYLDDEFRDAIRSQIE